MGDQQLYKTNHVAHSGENLFYQQPPLGVHGGLNHNYGNTVTGAGMEATQASPISPHFPQDTRDGLGLPVGSKNLGQVDTSRQGGWGGHTGPGNHVQLRGNLTNSNMMWGAPAQPEPADGYQYTYSQASEIRTQKLTSGVLHKLDSFTQVFANQNLRIQVNNMAQVLHTQSAVMDGAPDSALRQLLSQKPMEPPAPSVPPRYQQVPQQPHPGFTGGLSKPALQVGQHPSQGHLYYDYQQPLAQMPVQGGQPLQGPQMLSQHMQQMQQHQYYSPQQQQQGGQQRISTQEMQPQLQIRPPQLQQQQQQQQQLQQRQSSMQIPQYYQSPPMMQHLQEQQQQQMHLQPPSYHRDPHQYTPEQAHAVQLIQLGSMPQYYYQEPQQPYSHPLYQQSHLSQHQQREDSQPKTYSSERPVQAMQSSHGDLGPSDTGMGDPASLDLNRVSSALPHRPLLSPSGIHLNNMGPQHQQLSPSAMWPQMHLPDGRAQPGSPESSGQPKGVFGEQIDAKNKLTCSICLKEFKSLPALNGHMRSHGGMRASPSLKQEEGEKAPPPQPQPLPPPLPPQLPPEAESLTPMVMPVSVPVKLLVPKPSSKSFANSVVAAPSARDKPASSMSDDEMPVLVRMTLSPPHSPQGAVPCTPAETPRKHQPGVAKAEEPLRPAPEKERKKFRHRPEPLFIPPPPSYTPSPAPYSGATLYQSQLRSPRVLGDHLLLDPAHELPAYTPPPMLSPVRQGSGLFSNVLLAGQGPGAHPQLPLTPLTPTPRVLLCRSNSIDGSNVTVTPGPGEQTIDVEPRINIGLRFQAEIPELQDVSAVAQDAHKATLVWKPWPELENHDLQQRVEHLLNLCCSSALPGGGTNSEFALHCLFEAKGDVMAALEMLLLRKPVRLKCHPLANYHYAGSDKWTSLERKLFNKALATYSKDFIFVQKMVKSKTVAQCVEYYYTWKKIMRLGRKHRTRLTELIDDSVTSEEEDELEEEEEDQEEDRKSTREEESEVPKSPEPQPGPVLAPAEGPPLQALSQPSGSFICEMPNCGADCRCHVTPFLPQVFSSRQALNGHARIHGGTNQVTKARGAVPSGKQKPGSAQSGYCSVKSSPSHSTTSGETDPTTVFPCKECGKVFFKIKSRNAHMKTHRQQEEQQRQKAQKAAFAAEMAATIERTTGPVGAPGLLPLDQLSLIKPMKDVDILDDDVVQQLGGVMEEAEVVDADLLLDDQDSVLLQGDTEL
ncbi:transcriptional-regulating factor 1 isoform X1 [Artibeus jamaicensis]|uniref:transcriptional-regulating factor 1 isoform X1 n=1 Tax=Artibeus jamaicensis TaxID=9417 RepID=UPI00235A6453|nr:transcriptional-regulating factor 1 isoform X1 [Artibeus jamaicensis]XP_037010635.2 transcriptional-regulating factor 1 isoform X1 [Artibeus jamaicensis]XP_037010643.2 transcriptional-regulating factor 1 isoform X1 [Artibeus jamaicensis]XP_037010651.2 transcriptional-regulating factor 1 isoform X1 [Artibeus jamaicensis]XP_037010661.2 transcriptional-regulating factor 1 isoform X1 [Artibeus jamaicensis]XP_037010668.2 transcriptional-regulating factor 1 isoform X1 [Artibeus jamaicensis]XP_03